MSVVGCEGKEGVCDGQAVGEGISAADDKYRKVRKRFGIGRGCFSEGTMRGKRACVGEINKGKPCSLPLSVAGEGFEPTTSGL